MYDMPAATWEWILAPLGFLIFWLVESLAPFFLQSRRTRHAVRNLILAGTNAVLLAVVFTGVTIAVTQLAAIRQYGFLRIAGLGGIWHSAAAFVLLDAWTYWWHRANHEISLLWRFHRVHHSDPQMDVSTATRFHPGEITMSSILRLALIPLVGIPLGTLAIYDIVLVASTQFHHANMALPSRVDRFLRFGLVSPFMHKVHHSRVAMETDSNYSSVFSVWDRLFGSYREKADYRRIQFGLDGYDRDSSQSVAGLMTTPFVSRRIS